jgi:hypothetical protein
MGVAIGSRAPSATLDVVGDVRMVSAMVTNQVTFWDLLGKRYFLGNFESLNSSTYGTNFGFYNRNVDALSFYNPNIASNNWIMPGNLTALSVTLTGTTNQVTFGATNIPPASAVAPTKWISVQVAGEAVSYRLPLYQ